MAVNYVFLCEFTKSKVATTPANAPTIDIVDAANPTGALLVSAGSPTVMTNMAGVYVYVYTTATLTGIPVGLFKTADATVDLQQIPSYPQVVLDANGNVLSSPQTTVDVGKWLGQTVQAAVNGIPKVDLTYILGTLLTETAGQIAAAFVKFFNKATPTGTVNSLPDAVAGAMGGVAIVGSAMALTTGERGSTADAVWDEALSGHAGTGSAGKALTDAGAAGDPWAATVRTLTQAAASVASAVDGANLTIHRGDSFSATLTGLAANTGYSKIWFSVKRSLDDDDADAVIEILLSAPAVPATDGLQRLNGAAATAAQGSITVVSATSLTIALDEAATALLTPASNLVYDIQYLISGSVSTATQGNAAVTGDVTRAVS